MALVCAGISGARLRFATDAIVDGVLAKEARH
jgi:hypothetical protein